MGTSKNRQRTAEPARAARKRGLSRDAERQLIAFHEAGHAMVALILNPAFPPATVAIHDCDTGEAALGHVRLQPGISISHPRYVRSGSGYRRVNSALELLKVEVAILVAGRLAGLHFLGLDTVWRGDQQQWDALLMDAVKQGHLPDQAAAQRLFDRVARTTASLIRRREAAILRVACALLDGPLDSKALVKIARVRRTKVSRRNGVSVRRPAG